MLALARRLRRPAEINRVYAKGRWGGGQYLAIKALRTNLPASRCDIVVSRKISKKAVIRNRFRRQVAAAVAGLWQTITPGYDIVINVKTDLSALTASGLADQLRQGLNRAGA